VLDFWQADDSGTYDNAGTQLYLPDEPRNAADGIFDARLQMTVVPAGDGLDATFTFVVATQ
jgi:hypothetical protein